MKKGLKLALSFGLAALMLFVVTGCGEKTALTSAEFKTKMEAKDFTVHDASDQEDFAGIDWIKKVYVALDKNRNFKIEFYEITTAEKATAFFDNNKQIFEESKGNAAVTDVAVGNHAKYSLTSEGKFKVISRIDNTVIYSVNDSEFKDNVNEVLKDLGY